MKDDYCFQPSLMSQLSHELRIPLTGILGMVHFLNKTPLTPQQKKYLHQIHSFSKQLLSLEDKLHHALEIKN